MNVYVRRYGPIALALIVVAVIIVAIVTADKWSKFVFPHNPAATATSTPTPSATTTPSTTTTPSATTTATQFVINMPRRDGGRLNADGVDPSIRGNAEAFRKQISEQAARDPLTLYFYYQSSPYGKTNPLTNELVLAKDNRVENGNVYSSLGEETYKKWSALWNDPALTVITAVSEIKFQGSNTGATTANTPTQQGGVGGTDKSGYDIAYYGGDGTVVAEHSALNRCTQPTGSKLPNVPEGPTDNPPPPTTYDECPTVPGDQPPGTPCSKVGQIGPITNGAADPSGGRVEQTNNPVGTVQTTRPVVINPQLPGPAPTTAAPTVAPTTVKVITTAPATTVAPSAQPTKTGVVPTTAPSSACNPDFQNCT